MNAEGAPGIVPAPYTLAEYAELARAALSPETWDFIEGGAGQELTLAANGAAFDGVRLRPRVLTGAGRPDLAVRILGRDWAAPFAVAPVAHHTLVHETGRRPRPGRPGGPAFPWS